MLGIGHCQRKITYNVLSTGLLQDLLWKPSLIEEWPHALLMAKQEVEKLM